MKKTRFNWVITLVGTWVSVEMNGNIIDTFPRWEPGFAFNKQQVLKDIESSKRQGLVTVEGLDVLGV